MVRSPSPPRLIFCFAMKGDQWYLLRTHFPQYAIEEMSTALVSSIKPFRKTSTQQYSPLRKFLRSLTGAFGYQGEGE